MNIDFVNDKELKKLGEEMVLLSGRDMSIIVRNATKDALNGAYKATPLSERIRPYSPVIWRGKIAAWIAIPSRIIGRGFGAACWIKAMAAMGMSNKYGKNLKGKADAINFGYIKQEIKEQRATNTVGNTCPYIEELDKRGGIQQAGIDRAKKMLEQGIKKTLDKLQKKWNK